MQITEKFSNGMTIVQLEERFEMAAAAAARSRETNIDIHSGPGYIGVGTHINF